MLSNRLQTQIEEIWVTFLFGELLLPILWINPIYTLHGISSTITNSTGVTEYSRHYTFSRKVIRRPPCKAHNKLSAEIELPERGRRCRKNNSTSLSQSTTGPRSSAACIYNEENPIVSWPPTEQMSKSRLPSMYTGQNLRIYCGKYSISSGKRDVIPRRGAWEESKQKLSLSRLHWIWYTPQNNKWITMMKPYCKHDLTKQSAGQLTELRDWLAIGGKLLHKEQPSKIVE